MLFASFTLSERHLAAKKGQFIYTMLLPFIIQEILMMNTSAGSGTLYPTQNQMVRIVYAVPMATLREVSKEC